MNQVLIFLHFVGLMLGATGGFGSALVMRRALSAGPEAAGPLRALGPMLANVSAIGLALMWADRAGAGLEPLGRSGEPAAALLAQVRLRAVADRGGGAIHMTYAELRRGNMAAAARLPKLGPVAGVSALLAVLHGGIHF